MTPWTAAHKSPLSFTISQNLLKFMSIGSMMLSNHLIICLHLLLLPSVFSSVRVYSSYWLFSSGGQSIGASASVLPMNIQGWFPLGLTGLISLLPKGLSRVFSSITVWKHQFCSAQPLYGPNLTPIYGFWKNHSFDCMDLCWQSDVFAFKTLSRLVIVFLPRSKCLLISWLQEICHCFHFFPFYLPWTNGAGCMILVFWMLSFKPAFSLSFSPSSRGSLIPLHFLPQGLCHLCIWGCWYFFQQSWFQVVIHSAWHFTRCTLHRS